MRLKLFAAMALVASWSCTTPSEASPIVIEFTGTVTSVLNSPPGELWDGRVVPVGSTISSRYQYEINPANPQQQINATFAFTIAGLHRSTDYLFINVIAFDPFTHSEGDLYQTESLIGAIYPGGTQQYLETFGVLLRNPGGGALPLDPYSAPPNIENFATHAFYYEFQHPGGRVHIDGELSTLEALVSIDSPPAIALFASGLLALGPGRLASFCVVPRPQRRRC